MTRPRYAHADTPHDAELARLRLLEVRYDDITARRLDLAGPLAGARVLEVGAGAGSVARLLAERVGPGGSVVATDADPRFLADVEPGVIEVTRHDIGVDPLEESAFDLVHCRALLLHLSDPQRALARMAAAVRPGGWLLVEDADFTSFRALPGHPAVGLFDDVTGRMLRAYRKSGRCDPWFARRLAAAMDGLGLVRRGGEALEFRRVGGSVEAQLFAQGFESTRKWMCDVAAIDSADLDVVLAALADPTFAFVDTLNVAAWGVRPAAPSFWG